MFHPLRDAKAVFHDEPEDLASTLEARGLRLIEPGRNGEEIGVLPYLEEEAIARLSYSLGPLVPDDWKRENWEWWRYQWSERAYIYARQVASNKAISQTALAAAEMLIQASALRAAIKAGDPEKAAALGMLVASWVFCGGVSIRLGESEPLAKATRAAQRKKGQLDRTTLVSDDGERFKTRDLVFEALQAAGREAGTPSVWTHLWSVLEHHGFAIEEVGAKELRKYVLGTGPGITFKRVQTILAELRREAGANAPRKGRPMKKPR